MEQVKWGRDYAHKADAFAATPWWKKEAKEMIEHLPKKGRVLDFACNTGRFIEMAMKYDHKTLEYVGIDINKEGLEIARSRMPDVLFFHTLKNFKDCEFSHVVIMHAIPQFEDLEGTLAEIWRVMKRGATISVILHNKWYDWAHAPMNALNGYKGDATISHHFSKGQLKQTMWDAGFMCDEIKFFGKGLLPFLKHRIVFHGRKPE